jgi:hypothetical protein
MEVESMGTMEVASVKSSVAGRGRLGALGLALTLGLSISVLPEPVRAGHGGAFVGGMIAGHVISGAVQRDKDRTAAAEYQAYSQPQYTASQGSTTSSRSVEQRMDQLDKLAADGYISKSEYQKRKQKILDSV